MSTIADIHKKSQHNYCPNKDKDKHQDQNQVKGG